MQILDHIHVVGGGGFGLSNVTDGHVYLIDGGSEYALIDSGSGIESERIIQNIKDAGFDPSKVSVILLTHSHWDHARGSRNLAELTGADVAIHHGGADVLTDEVWRNHLVTKTGFALQEPRKADRLLSDGDVIKVGDVEITVLETLGHTSDAVCYLMEDGGRKVAFTGDTLVGEGALGATWYNTDFYAYKKGIERLHEYAPDAIFPGHRIFTLRNGTSYTQKAVDLFNGAWQGISPVGPPYYPSWWLLAYGKDVETM